VAGVRDPNTVDLVTKTPEGQYVLIMVEDRQWDGTNERIVERQTKIHNYVSFALDGQLAQIYPESKGHAVAIQLDCVAGPDASTRDYIDQMRLQLIGYGIDLRVNVLPP
jgi:hypothetical protein